MRHWYAVLLTLILFIGFISSNNAFGANWLSAKPGDNTRYLIDLVVDPLPRTLESFGLRYLTSSSENVISVETNAGPIMGLFLPRIINVNVETGEVITSDIPHKSWLYWLPANKQIGETILLDFGTVYNVSNVKLTVKELEVRSFQNQNVDVYIAEGESDGKTVTYVVEKSRGVVLQVSVKEGNKSLFEGKLVETNVKMQEATQTPIEEPPVQAPVLTKELEKEPSISVAVKEKKKVTLVAIKNNGDEEIFGVQMKIDDGKIRFVNVRGWDRDRIDQSTVIVQTSDRPIKSGKSLIIILVVDNRTSPFEWTIFDTGGNMIAKGDVART